MRDPDSLLSALPAGPFRLIAACHKNSIVNGRTQLNCSDNDRCDKSKDRSGISRYRHVHEDRELDGENQQERQTDRPEYEENDQEDQSDRDPVDDIKVVIRDPDQIRCARCLSDQHSGRIVLLEDRIELLHLRVDLIGRGSILAGDKDQLIIVRLKSVENFIRQHLMRKA